MKRILCCISLVTLLLCGCDTNANNIDDPAQFYYCTASVAYNSKEGVISSEVRDISDNRENLTELIQIYLRGPLAEHLRSPFPADTDVISVVCDNGIYTVTLSEDFSLLSGIDLTLACSCLSMTIMELTDADAVKINTSTGELDGQKPIMITKESLLLQDSSASASVPEQQ